MSTATHPYEDDSLFIKQKKNNFEKKAARLTRYYSMNVRHCVRARGYWQEKPSGLRDQCLEMYVF